MSRLFPSILVLCFFSVISIQGSYLHLKLTSQIQCGRQSFKKIYVCDPDKILGPGDDEASQLDVIIKKIANESICPCSSYFCEHENAGGYKVAVAVAKRMSEDDIVVDDDDGYDPSQTKQLLITKRLREASKIADSLLKKWKLGVCEEDVLLFYSHDDEVVYTKLGEVASKKLTRNLVNEITDRAIRRGFSSSPFDGIHSILTDYKAVFTNTYLSRSPRADHYRENTACLPSAFSPFSILLTTTITYLLLSLKL